MAPRYRAFLSASLRPEDAPLVDFIERSVLGPAGFDCYTVGRNVGAPEPPAETIKAEMQRCECLVIVATTRFNATDVHSGNVVNLAPGWIDSESGMAHMRGIPITPFKSKDVQLQGLLGANVTQWFEFDLTKETVAEYLLRNRALVGSHLEALRAKIDQARAARRKKSLVRIAKGAGLALLGAVGAYVATAQEDESEYSCYGMYDGRTGVCKGCPIRARCKRMRDASRS